MPYLHQISLTGQPASASFSIDRICFSVNFDWRMETSWLGWLLCQKVLRLDHLRLGGAYARLESGVQTGRGYRENVS